MSVSNSHRGGGTPEFALLDRLERYANDPVSATDAYREALMHDAYTHLASLETSSASTSRITDVHWFCEKSSRTTTEAASYLIRLHAYNSDHVPVWKNLCAAVIHSCCRCCESYENRKLGTRKSYLSDYPEEVLDAFFSSVDLWETEIVRAALRAPGGSSDSGALDAVIYHILSNVNLLRDVEFMHAIREYRFSTPRDNLPSRTPAGLYLLLADGDPRNRSYAEETARFFEIGSSLEGPAELVVVAILSRLEEPWKSPNSSPLLLESTLSTAELWQAFPQIIRLIPSQILRNTHPMGLKIKRLLISNLYSTTHFSGALNCFLELISLVGSGLWIGENSEFPGVVFDSIKDNPGMHRILSVRDPDQTLWNLEWTVSYLNSVWTESCFPNTILKVFVYLGEELQRTSYTALVHIQALKTLFSTIRALQAKASSMLSNKLQIRALRDACETHAEIISRAAFGQQTEIAQWVEVRCEAIMLLRQIFETDVKSILRCLQLLCPFRDEQMAISRPNVPTYYSKFVAPLVPKGTSMNSPLPAPVEIHSRLWCALYASIEPIKGANRALMLSIAVVAPLAHIDPLNGASEEAFSSGFLRHHKEPEVSKRYSSCVESINTSLATMRKGFRTAVEDYAEASGRRGLADFLGDKDAKMPEHTPVVASVVQLMLSPNPELSSAAKSLALNAYDTVERSECYLSFLADHPNASLKGINQYLDSFNKHALLVPDACGGAKSLVRSLKDILDALCEAPGFLLANKAYARAARSELLQMWRLMSNALSTILQRVKFWAQYHPTEDMVLWMRDALIFGRDLVAQAQTLQQAVNSDQEHSAGNAQQRKKTQKSISMMADLGNVFAQLIQWLKLTDHETLHQAHELLKTMLNSFALSTFTPPKDAITTLEHYTERRKGTRTELDDAKLSELLIALDPFIDEKDEARVQSRPQAKTAVTKPSIDLRKTEIAVSDHILSGFKNSLPTETGTSMSRATNGVTKTRTEAASRPSHVLVPTPQRLLPSDLAVLNYKKMQAPKAGASNILSGPTKPIAPPILVESASSADGSSSDDDDDDDGLSTLRKPPSPKKLLRQEQRRQVKIMPAIGLTSSNNRPSRQEEAKRQEMRMRPDLDSLHRYILQWDYDYDGDTPTDSSLKPAPVPDAFPTAYSYRDIFEPLIVYETWSSLIKSKEEAIPVVPIEIAARRHVDSWVDLDITITDMVPPKWYLTETDIVLLRPLEGKGSVLAKVMSVKRGPDGLHACIRCSLQTETLKVTGSALSIRSHWNLSRVFSLSTVHREYGALMGLPYYDLLPAVLNPVRRQLTATMQADIRDVMQTYKVNKPQATAIVGALDTPGFSLIQGPPGTGKTSTIMGLVSRFISKRGSPVTRVVVGRGPRPDDKEPVKKILICAPSNAAIDEVAYRLKQGIRNGQGTLFVPKVVRVGNDEKISPLVREITLDELVGSRVGNDAKTTDLSRIRENLNTIKETLYQKLKEVNGPSVNSDAIPGLEKEIRELKTERTRLSLRLDTVKDENEKLRRNREGDLRLFQAQVLNDADVICATLSGSGHKSLAPYTFETVIIDEAAQSVELSSLIPLKYGTKQAILVGDPQQLAPTVLSNQASRFLYNQSLFVRLYKRQPAYLLSIQYRMHPEISRLPSRIFYESKLTDGDDMARLRTMRWHAGQLFKPYCFFDVADGREQKANSGFSLLNRAEALLALALYERLNLEFSAHEDFDNRIGIIAMYDAQKKELQRVFTNKFGPTILKRITFNTVDGFQGQEKDIIIVSAVRAGPSLSTIGHVSDMRRMNVAVTRARASLFILGHAATLERSDDKWKGIIVDARERKMLVKIELSKSNGQLKIDTPLPIVSSSSGSSSVRVAKPIAHPSTTTKAISSIPIMKPGDFVKSSDALGISKSSGSTSDHVPSTALKRKASLDGEPGPSSPMIPTIGQQQYITQERPPLKKRPKPPTTMFIPKTGA